MKLLSALYKLFYLFRGVGISKYVLIRPGVFLSLGIVKGIKGAINIGDNCELSNGVIIKAYGGKIELKKNVFLGEHVVLYGHGGIEIGENTMIAMHSCIISSNHTVPDRNELIRSKPDILMPVKIGADVWIGAGVKILGGVNIGNGCVVGAGAVVTKDLPPYATAVGVPARIINYRNE